MDNTKQNDWFVASLLSPEKNFQDFKLEGVTPDNTTVKDRATYRDNKKIQEMFKDSNGVFDETSFNQFYNGVVSSYNKFANDEFDDNIKNAPEYFKYTSLKPKNGKQIKPFEIQKVSNPFEQTVNLQGLNVVGESKLSIAELAQKNKVKDHKTGKDLNWTPNEDGGLFSIFSKPTTAIAQYDEDGYETDPETGRVKRHKKGDFKLNENGKFYYETLGKRDPAGKQILSIWDSNTVDGSFANKFDFMDSDDKEKSIGGSVVKTIARVAPLFIPGVGEYYAGVTIGQELLEVLPLLAQSGASLLFGEDQKNKDYYKSLTSMRSFKRSMDTGVSEYSKQHVFSAENVLQMVGDVFGQLKQQKLIASIPQKIGWTKAESAAYRKGVELYGDDFVKFMTEKGYNNASLSNKLSMMQETIPGLGKMIRGYDQLGTVWARGLSNMYMASTSAAGVVDDARNNGLSEKETAALFLGTMSGYSAMMAKLDIGHWATKGLGLDETGNLIKKAVKENAEEVASTLKNVIKETPNETKKLNKIFNVGKSIGKFVSNKVTNIDDYYGAMLGEGIEEVTEEAMSDSIKTIYNGLSALGITPTKDKQFKFSGEEMVQRYAMSLLGGALGGAIFKASERMAQDSFDNKDNSVKTDLIHLIRNGHADEILKTIDKYEKKGLLGNKNLSLDLDESTSVADNEINYKPSSNPNDNQNTYIANILKAEINTVRNIMFQENIPTDRIIDDIYNNRLKGIFDFKINTSVRDDVNDLTSQIITVRNEIAKLKSDSAGKEDLSLQSAINEKEKQLADLSFEMKKIASGEYYERYLSEGLFNINTALNGPFSVKDKNRIALSIYNKPLNELTDEESESVESKFKEYIESDRKVDLKKAKEKFDAMFKDVTNMAETLNDYGNQRYGYYAQTMSYPATISELTRPDAELPAVEKPVVELGVFNPSAIGEDDAVTLTNIINSTPYLDIEIKNRAGHILDSVNIKDPEFVNITGIIDESVGNILPDGSLSEYIKDVFSYSGLTDLMKIDSYSNVNLSKLDDFQKEMNEYYSSDEFAKELADITDGDFEVSDFIRILDNFVDTTKANNLETINKLTELKNSLDNKKSSPIQNLISKINLSNDDIDQKSIFDLLSQEISNMNDKSDLSQYIIENQVTEKQIDTSIEALNQLESAINGATDFTYREGFENGYVSTINRFKKDSGDTEISAISVRSNASLIKDINIIRTKLLFFRKLSQINQESKIKNQKSAGLMAQGLFFNMISEDQSVRDMFKTIGINISELDELIDNSPALKNVSIVVNDTEGRTLLDLNNDNIKAVELEMTKIESYLYNSFQSLRANDKTVVNKVNELFDPVDLAKMDATEFTSLTRSLKEYDKFIYLNTILNSDSLKFKKELYGTDGEVLSESKFAPFFSQEYYSRIFYWMLEDRFSYNSAIHYFKRKTNLTQGDPLYDSYKDELYSQLYNSLLIYGRPGVGKTTGTISIIGKILSNRGINSTVYGPTDTQGDNLFNAMSDSLVANETSGKSKDDIMKLILGDAVYAKLKSDREKLKFAIDFKPAEDSLLTMQKSSSEMFMRPVLNKEHPMLKDFFAGNNISPDLLVNGKSVGAIIIDEITHYSTDEIELIHQAVLNHNRTHKASPITLILSGDPNQSGYTINGYNSNINFFKGISGPYLSISMRSGYNLKANNLDSTFSILNAIKSLQRKNNNRTTEAQVGEFIESASNIINLKYSQDGSFVGDKIVGKFEKHDIDQMLSNTTGKIGVIYTDENSDLVKLIKTYPDYEDKFDIKTPETVQGLEYDYALIDVVNPNAKENIVNALTVAKSINTLISRSRIGSIISEITVNGLNISSDNKDAIVVKTELPMSQIEEFKTLRIDSLKNSIDKIVSIEPDVVQQEESKEITTDSEQPTSKNEAGESIIPEQEPEEQKTIDDEIIEPEYDEPDNQVLSELRSTLIGIDNVQQSNRDKSAMTESLYNDSKSFMYTMYDRFGINIDAQFTGEIKQVDNEFDFGFLYEVIYGKRIEIGQVVNNQEYMYIVGELKKLKGALYNYSVKKKQQELYGKDYFLEDHLKAYNVDRRIIDSIDIDSAKVGIRVKHFNPLTDKTFSLTEENPKQTNGGLGRFVVVEFYNTDGDKRGITIGSLPSPYVDNNKIKGDATNLPPMILENLKSIDRIFENESQRHDADFEIIRYFNNDFNSITRFSNIMLKQLGKDENNFRIKQSLNNFSKKHKHLTVSRPYIYTGSEFTLKNSTTVSESAENLITDDIYNQRIIGKAVVLVSNDKTLKSDELRGYLQNQIKESIEEHNHRINENRIRKERLANGEEYTQKPFERRYPDVIKMIPLDLTGEKFSDWYNRQLELINMPKATPEKILKLKSHGDKFVGTRIYNSIYNFIQDIEFIKKNSKVSYDNDIFNITPNDNAKVPFNYYSGIFADFKFPVRGNYRSGFEAILGFQETAKEMLGVVNKMMSNNGIELKIDESNVVGKTLKERRLKAVFDAMPDQFDFGSMPEYSNFKYNQTYALFNALKTVITGGKFGNVSYKEFIHKPALNSVMNGLDTIVAIDFPLGIFYNTITLSAKKRTLTDNVPFIIETENPAEHYSIDVDIVEPTLFVDLSNLETLSVEDRSVADENAVDSYNRMTESLVDNIRKELSEVVPVGGFDSVLNQITSLIDSVRNVVSKDNVSEMYYKVIEYGNSLLDSYFNNNKYSEYNGNYYRVNFIGIDEHFASYFDTTDVTKEINSSAKEYGLANYTLKYNITGDSLKAIAYDAKSKKIATFEYSKDGLKSSIEETADQISKRIFNVGNNLLEMIQSSEYEERDLLSLMINRIMAGDTSFSQEEKKSFTDRMSRYYNQLDESNRSKIKELTEEFTNRISCL